MTPDAARRRATLLLGLLALVWGTNWALMPVAMREVSVWTFRSLTMTLAALVLLGAARARGLSLRVPRQHWPWVAGGALFNLALWNIATGMATILIPSGQAAVLGFTMPVWLALISFLVLGQRLSARQWLSVALAAAGVALLAWRGAQAYSAAPLGMALALLAAFSWAVGTLVLKRCAHAVPALVLAGWQMLLADVPVTLGALLLGQGPWFMPSATSLLVLCYIALVPMAVGNLTWTSIVALLPPQVAGLSSVLVPVVAMVSGAIVHREPLGPVQILAMLCCCGALALTLVVPAKAAAVER